MAPVLQCPDCGTKHPLDIASSAAAFRCSGCGRTLKVPEQYRAAVAPPADAAGASMAAPSGAAPGAAPDRDRTSRMQAVRPERERSPNGVQPLSRRTVRAQAGVVPFWMRLGVWLLAVPLGFVIVFGLARLLGFLTQTQLEDVFLDSGWDRFWPVARLLPFVALVTAALVHFSILFVSRWRVRHSSRPLQPRVNAPREAPGSQWHDSSEAQTPSA